MFYEFVIKNGEVVTDSDIRKIDVGITDGTIACLDLNLSGKREIDAGGRFVVPGAVDMHVHLEMAAGDIRSTDDFYSGSKAAALGGTTTIVDFVEPEPQQSLLDALSERRRSADKKAVIDYGLHMTIGPDQMDKLDEIPAVCKAGSSSFKHYMAYDFNLSDGQLYKAFRAVGDSRGLAIVHAENWSVIETMTEEFIASGRTSPEWHTESRPALMEGEAVGRAAALARLAGVPLHVFHISCEEGVKALSKARNMGQNITGETCPQYLLLTSDVYKREGVEGALSICSPPLREKAHQDYLWKSLSRGDLQVLSTDHCPFTREEKGRNFDRFDCIPGGVPSIEIRLSSLYSEGVKKGLLTVQQWVNLCCTAPADLLGYKNKGRIAVGADADIVIFDPDKKVTVSTESLDETADWSPYEGLEIEGWPETVLSRGEVIVYRGEFTGAAGRGRFLQRSI